MRRVIVAAMCWAGAGVLVAGADVWEAKPFMTWSDNEVREVLTDSPWSRGVQVVMNTLGRGGAGGIESEGGRGGGGGEGGDPEGGGGGGGRRGGGLPGLPPQLKLLVSWRSAR